MNMNGTMVTCGVSGRSCRHSLGEAHSMFIVVLALGYGQWCGVLQLYCVRVCEGVYAGSVTNGNGVACCVPPRPILQPHMRLNYYTLCLFNYCID